MTKLALHIPLNQVSFGQVSSVLLRTLFDRDKAGLSTHDIYILPIGGVDISSQTNISQEFVTWVQSKIGKSFESYSRDIPVFKLWHLNGSLESFARKQTLLSFYELDSPTKVEINIAKNNNLCLSSQYSCDVFRTYGIESNLITLPFDSYNFKRTDKVYHNDGRIVFNICGKLEKRKHHAKMIKSWIVKYGNNPKYALQCATYNIFLGSNPQECDANNNEMIRQILEGKSKPFNVNFLPHMKENAVYNDFLNSGHIILGMSGGEGWGLPEFQSIALGKHAVLLNAHSYKTWATSDMATFVNPSAKIPVYDNMFFKQGEPFNQGNIFDWNEEEFLAACDSAISKAKSNPINSAGLSLQDTYNKDKFVDNVLRVSSL